MADNTAILEALYNRYSSKAEDYKKLAEDAKASAELSFKVKNYEIGNFYAAYYAMLWVDYMTYARLAANVKDQ